MKKTLKMALLLIAALLILVITAGCGGGVVAIVNGESITSKELSQKLAEARADYEEQGLDFSGDTGKNFLDSLQREILDQMINNKLLLQEAKKMAKLTPEQIQEKIKPFRDQFPAEEEYRDFLNQIDISEEDAAYILNLQEEVTKDVPPVSEADTKKYYEENLDQFSQPEQLQVRHILFFVDEGDKGYPARHTDDEAIKMAEDVIAQLKQGKDFAELAREKSEDSGSKENGGFYMAGEDSTVKEFYDAANSLREGEYTDQPVKTEYGYHVIKFEKRIPAQQQTFDQVKEQLVLQLNEQAKQDKFNEFMEEAKSRAVIINKLAAG